MPHWVSKRVDISKYQDIVLTETNVESLKLSSVPLAFDCHLTRRHTRAGVVTYDGCFVDTTGGAINKNTGIFTVKAPGIYQVRASLCYVTKPCDADTWQFDCF